MPIPIDQSLYDRVKKEADKKFLAPTSIYKSAWIVSEYKKRGGIYKEDHKNPKQGLIRWFKERWVDLTRPILDKKGHIIDYEECGRKEASIKGIYPLCRPVNRITKETPKTVKEISTKSIEQAKKDKQKIKEKGHINFQKKTKDNKK